MRRIASSASGTGILELATMSWEFPPRVRPAQSVCRITAPVEPFVAIGLQQAAETLQMRLGVVGLAILTLGIGHGRIAGSLPESGISRVAPEPAGLGPSPAWVEHRQTRVVREQ